MLVRVQQIVSALLISHVILLVIIKGFYFAGLKTVIGELSHLSSQVTASVSRTITRKLLTAFKNPVSKLISTEICYQILFF